MPTPLVASRGPESKALEDSEDFLVNRRRKRFFLGLNLPSKIFFTRCKLRGKWVFLVFQTSRKFICEFSRLRWWSSRSFFLCVDRLKIDFLRNSTSYLRWKSFLIQHAQRRTCWTLSWRSKRLSRKRKVSRCKNRSSHAIPEIYFGEKLGSDLEMPSAKYPINPSSSFVGLPAPFEAISIRWLFIERGSRERLWADETLWRVAQLIPNQLEWITASYLSGINNFEELHQLKASQWF